MLLSRNSYGLDPEKTLSQYVRDRWGIEKGFSSGEVRAFAQTPDGYLWIGAATGLLRFDGLSFQPVYYSRPPSYSITDVLGLTTDEEGALWVKLRNGNLLIYRNQQFEDALLKIHPREIAMTAMNHGIAGSVLLSGIANGVSRSSQGEIGPLLPASVLPTSPVISVC